MSTGPIGSVAGVFGTGYAQRAADLDRAAQETAGQDRRVAAEAHAEMAAGIGQTEGEGNEAADRDADGRRPFEQPATPRGQEDGQPPPPVPRARDATGQLGNALDCLA